jgi:hypothetical protein
MHVKNRGGRTGHGKEEGRGGREGGVWERERERARKGRDRESATRGQEKHTSARERGWRRRKVAELGKNREAEEKQTGTPSQHPTHCTHAHACVQGWVRACVRLRLCVCVGGQKNIQNLIIALIFNLVAIQKGAVSRLEIHQIRLHLE